jgi:glycolate oxidase FAD binding subunit
MFMGARSALPTSTGSNNADLTEDLAQRVREAAAGRTPLRIIGGDTKAFYGRSVDGEPFPLTGHRGIVSYEPSELVITARAGTPLIEIEALLAAHDQMLAFEPPAFGALSTIGGVVASGLAGSRRPFTGAVRDFLLGATVMDGQGRPLRFGGTVFKNVAGFDAFRLMAGALGCLGVILDVSLRVAPKPRAESFLSFDAQWPEAAERIDGLVRRPLPLSGAFHHAGRLHLRLSGPRAAVAAATAELGGEVVPGQHWDELRHMRRGVTSAARLWRLSVPRAAGVDGLDGEWLHDWAGAQRWLATDLPATEVRDAAIKAGGHATLFRGAGPDEAVFTPLAPPLLTLHRRLKSAFDPAGIFNPGRMYEEF